MQEVTNFAIFVENLCTYISLVPSDYFTEAAGQITFTPGGPDEMTIQLRVRADQNLELNETFTLRLSLPSASIAAGGQLGLREAAEVTIINDDCKTTFFIKINLNYNVTSHSCTSVLPR